MEHLHDHGHYEEEKQLIAHLPTLEQCEAVAEVFKQISDGSRLRILYLLCHSEMCVSNIAAAVGMTDPAVSHHLKTLKRAGILSSRREGKEVYYKLAENETSEILHHVIDEVLRINCPLK